MIATNTNTESVMSTSTEIGDLFDFLFEADEKHLKRNPHSFLMEPVYAAFEENPELVGILVGVTAFSDLLDRILPTGANGIVCVIRDKCGDAITYEINGPKATFLGQGDLHDSKFDKYERSAPMEFYDTFFEGRCAHDLYIYPSIKFKETHMTNYPAVYTSVVAVAFFVTAMLMLMYDRCVLFPLINVSLYQSFSLLTIFFPLSCEGWSLDDKTKRCSLSSKPTDSSGRYSPLTSAIVS
jgi:hypothetical protein